VAGKTASFEEYPDLREKNNSRYRANKLKELFEEKRGNLNSETVFSCLSDHSAYPRGICRHIIGDSEDEGTSVSVAVDPGCKALYATKGNPCENEVHIYKL